MNWRKRKIPTGNNEPKGIKFGIHINGKDHEYESFEELFSDFVEEMLAETEEAEQEEETSEIQKAADAIFDLFTCYIKAGFIENPALYLIANIMKGGTNHA